MKIEVIDLKSPPVQHVLVSERAPLKLKTDRKYYWLFTDDYYAKFNIDGEEVTISIKKGFESDGASIPRVAGIMRGLAFRGYFIHDQLYTNHLFSRIIADKIMKASIEYEGVDKVDSQTIYTAVRFFGGSHYEEE